MQIKYPHKRIRSLFQLPLSRKKCEREPHFYEASVRTWRKLKTEGVSDGVCQEVTGISRATFYRRQRALERLNLGLTLPSQRPKNIRKPLWSEAQIQQVLAVRRANPTYGKAKIAQILRRDQGSTLSESTVGRILKSLMNRGLVIRSACAPRKNKKRRFTGHAKPYQYGMKPKHLGQLIQIDHMSVSKNNVHGKHFQAWCPLSRYMYANLFSKATSRSAKQFLLELREAAPFPVSSVQVDGGSEFMAEFEQACAELDIQLYVLPPKRPQWNGGVERGNRTFREEFYDRMDLIADSLPRLREELFGALNKYNAYRPHFSLSGLTPLSYIRNHYLEAT